MIYRFCDPFAKQLDEYLLSKAENKYLCLYLSAFIIKKLLNEDFKNPTKRYLIWELK